MKLFNKANRPVDERIVNIQNKIYKDAYMLAVAVAVVSIIVKFYLYGVNSELVTTEFLVIFIPALYYLIKEVSLGIYSDEVEVHDRTSKMPMSVKNIIIGLGLGVVMALYFGIRNSMLYGNAGTRLWYFILVFFATIVMYCPFFALIMAISHAAAKRASKRAAMKEQDE